MKFKEKFYQLTDKILKTDSQYIVNGFFWTTIGKIANLILGVILVVAMTNFLSKENYGTYQYIISLIGVLTVFSLPGIEISLTKAIGSGREGTLLRGFKEKIKWGAIGSLISFVIAIYYFFHQNFILGISFFIASFFISIMDSFRLFLPFWQAKKNFYIQTKYFVFTQFFSALIIFLTVILTKNIIFIILAYFLSYTFFRAIAFYLTLKKVENNFVDSSALVFGKHLTLMQIVDFIGGALSQIFIWHFLGAIATAVYSLAIMPVVKILEFIPIWNLALPKLISSNISKINLFKKSLKLFWISIPLTIVYIVFIPFVFNLFFPHYSEAISYSQIAGIIIFFFPFSLLATSFYAQEQKKNLYLGRIVTFLTQIISLWVFIPLYHLWGAIISLIIVQIVSCVLTIYLFIKNKPF